MNIACNLVVDAYSDHMQAIMHDAHMTADFEQVQSD
jgi:hypothetical protein